MPEEGSSISLFESWESWNSPLAVAAGRETGEIRRQIVLRIRGAVPRHLGYPAQFSLSSCSLDHPGGLVCDHLDPSSGLSDEDENRVMVFIIK